MKIKLLLIVGMLSALVSQSSIAAGFSLGLQAGQSSNDIIAGECEFEIFLLQLTDGPANYTCTSDDSDTAVGINFAYDFTDMWGLELGYIDLGEYSAFVTVGSGTFFTTGTPDSALLSLETTVKYVAGKVTFKLADQWSLTGRLGAARLEEDFISREFAFEYSESETVPMAGLSINYQFNDKIMALLRFDYFDAESDYFDNESSYDVASLGLNFKF